MRDDAGIACQLARRSLKDSNNAAESGRNTGRQARLQFNNPVVFLHADTLFPCSLALENTQWTTKAIPSVAGL